MLPADLLFTSLFALITACSVPPAVTGSNVPVATPSGGTVIRPANDRIMKLTREVHELVNEYRLRKGLSVLAWNEAAASQALIHSQNMASRKIGFGHGGFNERVDKLRKLMPAANAFSENVAMGYPNAREVVDGWISSTGHRKNMEGAFNAAGIGISDNGALYYTQIFVRTN